MIPSPRVAARTHHAKPIKTTAGTTNSKLGSAGRRLFPMFWHLALAHAELLDAVADSGLMAHPSPGFSTGFAGGAIDGAEDHLGLGHLGTRRPSRAHVFGSDAQA